MAERDYSIDIMRFIALAGLICVHIAPPDLWVRELRSFDVPLMVFLSGVSFSMASGKNIKYWEYIKKRFTRILLPTWIFLLIYFIIHYALTPSLFFRTSTLVSFSLFTGFYTWIMRVFLIVAILSPFVLVLINKITTFWKVVVLMLALILNEIIIRIFCGGLDNGDLLVMIEMNLPYLIIFCVGSYASQIKRKYYIPIALLCFLAYVIIAVLVYLNTGAYPAVSRSKYPPQFYYLVYGFAWIFFLWHFRFPITDFMGKIKLKSFAQFIGSHTMWIYFWHILLVEIVMERLAIDSALIRFFLVFFSSILLTYLQSKFVTKVGEHLEDVSKRKLLYTLFNG